MVIWRVFDELFGLPSHHIFLPWGTKSKRRNSCIHLDTKLGMNFGIKPIGMMFSSLASHTSVRTRRAVTSLIFATTNIIRYSHSALLDIQAPGQYTDPASYLITRCLIWTQNSALRLSQYSMSWTSGLHGGLCIRLDNFSQQAEIRRVVTRIILTPKICWK